MRRAAQLDAKGNCVAVNFPDNHRRGFSAPQFSDQPGAGKHRLTQRMAIQSALLIGSNIFPIWLRNPAIAGLLRRRLGTPPVPDHVHEDVKQDIAAISLHRRDGFLDSAAVRTLPGARSTLAK